MHRVWAILGVVWLSVLAAATPVAAGHAGRSGVDAEPGRAYFDFGFFALEDGQLADALRNFRQAVELEPDNALYYQYLGRAYQEREEYPLALTVLEQAKALEPGLPELSYDIAYTHFKLGDFSRAAGLFDALSSADPANVLARYHAGISYYRLSRYRAALEHFQAAIELSPTIRTNGSYYAGICHLKLREFDQARDRMEYVLANATGPLRENAGKWLQAVERGELARPWYLYAKVGRRYDDNVRLEALDRDLFADGADWLTVGYAAGGYTFDRGPGSLTVNYSHYQTVHDDLGEYDLSGGLAGLDLRYFRNSWQWRFQYQPSWYWLDNESYLLSHRLQPMVECAVTKRLTARLTAAYVANNYLQDKERTGHATEIGVSFRQAFRQKSVFLTGGLMSEAVSASHPNQYYDRLRTWVGLSADLPWEVEARLTCRYEDKEYRNADTFYGVHRRDNRYQGVVSVSRPLSGALSVVADYRYTRNESNILDFDYRRNALTVSLAARY